MEELKMSALSTLKLLSTYRPKQISPLLQRRAKLVTRLCEQMALARAQQMGEHYAPTRLRTYKDQTTGARQQVTTTKRVKAWWFAADNGRVTLCVRYGSKPLELAKGKFAVDIAQAADLLPTLELLKTAVAAGELDAQLEATALKLRGSFGK
jgi:hypothetical protein